MSGTEKEHHRLDDETMKKMQSKMLDMLLYYKDFCDKYGLRFVLIGGGAIGCAREHGFVPWDDDVDCSMPRPDYEKFRKLWAKYGDKERYVYCRSNEKVNYHHQSSSLRDPNTTFIVEYNKNLDICHGLALEFGPWDAVPDSKILRARQLFNAFVYAIFNNQRLPNNKGKLVRIITRILFFLVPTKKMRDKIWMHAEKEMSKYSWEKAKYIRQLGGSIKHMFNLYPKSWMEERVFMDFEGYKMPMLSGYDKYLSTIFGDYMKRPPVDQQVAKHPLDFVDMDHPYTYYKNKKYFPGRKGKVGGAM